MSYADSTKEDSAANPLWNLPPHKGEGRCRSIPPLDSPLFFVRWNIGWALEFTLDVLVVLYCKNRFSAYATAHCGVGRCLNFFENFLKIQGVFTENRNLFYSRVGMNKYCSESKSPLSEEIICLSAQSVPIH